MSITIGPLHGRARRVARIEQLHAPGLAPASLIYLLLATPWARQWLEATMSAHMLVQIPLLAGCGFLAASALGEARQARLLAALGGPVPCLLAALLASSYWMLPRALDAALVDPLTELAKFLTLPALVGAPLALAWRPLGAIGRGFVWNNLASMLAVLGWLYLAAPVRICNSYSVFDQTHAGWSMVWLALGLFGAWLGSLFVRPLSGPNRSQTRVSTQEGQAWTT